MYFLLITLLFTLGISQEKTIELEEELYESKIQQNELLEELRQVEDQL